MASAKAAAAAEGKPAMSYQQLIAAPLAWGTVYWIKPQRSITLFHPGDVLDFAFLQKLVAAEQTIAVDLLIEAREVLNLVGLWQEYKNADEEEDRWNKRLKILAAGNKLAAQGKTVLNLVAACAMEFLELPPAALRPGQNKVEPPSFMQSAIFQELAAMDVQKALKEDGDSLATTVLEHIAAWPSEAVPPARPRWCMKIDKAFYLNVFTDSELCGIDELVFALERMQEEELEEALDFLEARFGDRNRIRLALPSVMRNDVNRDWTALVERLYRAGWRRWEFSHLGAWQLFEAAGINSRNLNVTTDWPLHVLNRMAAKFLQENAVRQVTLSPEDHWDNWLELIRLLGPMVTVPVHMDFPLAISATCLKASMQGLCMGHSTCDFTQMTLTNKANERLLAINNQCQTVLIHDRPFHLGGHIRELLDAGATNFRADFIWRQYTPVQVRSIWNKLLEDTPMEAPWTAHLLS